MRVSGIPAAGDRGKPDGTDTGFTTIERARSGNPRGAPRSHGGVMKRILVTGAGGSAGINFVDLKENKAGAPCVTEINIARFFTTSNFFAAAGSNMPWYYLMLAFGEELPELPRFNAVPAGLYWIRLMDKGPVLAREEEFRVALQTVT